MIAVNLYEHVPIRYEISQIDEFDESEEKLYLTKETINQLERINHSLGTKVLDIGYNSITPLNHIGVIKTRGHTFQLLPKLISTDSYGVLEEESRVVMGNVVKMIEIAYDLKIRRLGPAELDTLKNSGILEFLIRLYAVELLHQLNRNIYRDYHLVRENSRFVKGRILFNVLVREWHRLNEIPIEYTMRGIDNKLNRLLKYATIRMRKATRNDSNYSLLTRILENLSDVSYTHITVADFDRLKVTRLNQEYKPIINLARMFLEGFTFILRKGEITGFSFLIKTDKLYEKFMSRMLRRTVNRISRKHGPIQVQLQPSIGRLVRERGHQLKPDIILKHGENTIIIDLKYKILQPKINPSINDLYQIYTYGTIKRASKVSLLYPSQTKSFHVQQHFTTSHSNRELPIIIAGINLSRNLLNPKEWQEFKNDLTNY
ncbi:MAG: McrC family protein, partial [Desulfurococcales archaeon]|nr:McrC family protein [Desulfurococcales archaeon]